MEIIKNIIILFCLLGGSFFFLVGIIGLIRFPDIFSRIHAATKCDTMGAGLMLLGLMIYEGLNIISLKLLFILVFIFITSPTASHLVAKAVFQKANIKVKEKSLPLQEK